MDGIGKAGAVGRIRGNGTVNVYVAGIDSDADASAMAEVSALIAQKRALGIDAQVFNAYHRTYDLDVVVTAKTGWDEDEVEERITQAFTAYLTSIPLGGRLYLSTLGKYLLDTDCIETYDFDIGMADEVLPQSQYFVPGDITIEVS